MKNTAIQFITLFLAVTLANFLTPKLEKAYENWQIQVETEKQIKTLKALSACAKDVEKFCPSSQDQDGSKIKCLVMNKESITKECYLDTVQPFLDSWSVCKDDLAKLCPGQQFGTGKAIPCLRENGTNLSKACKIKMGL